MIIRVFTSNHGPTNEIDIIQGLFDQGLDVLHLRKKAWSIERYSSFLHNIPHDLHSKIIIHDHYDLIDSFNVGGLHLSSSTFNTISKDQIDYIHKQKWPWALSTSAHHHDELDQLIKQVDHVVVGPVFSSISKIHYHPSTQWQISDFPFRERLIAIGGIRDTSIDQLNEFGFKQIGILGYIWMNDHPINQFKKICSKVKDQLY